MQCWRVEAIDGTDATISGGRLARGGGVAVKVAKPDQDMRFDVPTIGLDTLETAIASGLQAMALEAARPSSLMRRLLLSGPTKRD